MSNGYKIWSSSEPLQTERNTVSRMKEIQLTEWEKYIYPWRGWSPLTSPLLDRAAALTKHLLPIPLIWPSTKHSCTHTAKPGEQNTPLIMQIQIQIQIQTQKKIQIQIKIQKLIQIQIHIQAQIKIQLQIPIQIPI